MTPIGGRELPDAPLKGGVARYTTVAIALHWIVAVLMLVNIALGLSADVVPDGYVRSVVDMHKSVGITVLGLAILRILWRASHKPPPLPASYSPLERLSAHAAHGLLYLLILALPISGWMHDSAWSAAATHPMSLYGLIPWARIGWIENVEPIQKEHLHTVFFNAHVYFGYALYLLLALHIIGALKHQFWDREAELQRMLPGGQTGVSAE
ncbi:MAG: cytochrome b/b6 domain-containing protein [Methylocella sp.]